MEYPSETREGDEDGEEVTWEDNMVGEAAYERMNWFLVKLCLVLISFSWSALQPQCKARFDEFKLPILPIFYKKIFKSSES